MLDFYKTGGGRRLIDSTLPEIARQLKRVADELRRANRLKEIEMGIRGVSPADVAKEFIEGAEGEKSDERGVTPEAWVQGVLRQLEDQGEGGMTIRKVPGNGCDFMMMQNQRVRGMLIAAGVKIVDEEDGEITISKERTIIISKDRRTE